MQYLLLLFLLYTSLYSKYLTNYSCKECHEEIYNEFKSSAHSKSFFNDELHRKIALKVSNKKYECVVCHMPMADNLKDLINGKAKPNIDNKTHKDAISCFFCHTIAYVKKAHKYNLNLKAKQAKGYKPTLFGNLENAEDSNKHSSLKSPIYSKVVCSGCHSHKINDFNTTIFNAMNSKQDSKECIKCHMPQPKGGVEKLDKRARGVHKSHKFLGIRDKEFRAKGVDIDISVKNRELKVKLTNKMAHPLIVQPARAKYIDIKIKRGNKIVWSNYKKSPIEDTRGYFAYFFKKDGKEITLPSKATSSRANNIEAKESRVLNYKIPKLNSGDVIELNFWVQLAKDDCTKEINLKDKSYLKPMLIKKVIKKIYSP